MFGTSRNLLGQDQGEARGSRVGRGRAGPRQLRQGTGARGLPPPTREEDV